MFETRAFGSRGTDLPAGSALGDDDQGEVNPLASMANLFDVAMVFAVAMMVALVSYLRLPALLQDQDYTVITNPGRHDMEIIVKEGTEITHYEASDQVGVGQGELLGQAYRLPDGRVVYVPADRGTAGRQAEPDASGPES
jgi:hypothetical protein